MRIIRIKARYQWEAILKTLQHFEELPSKPQSFYFFVDEHRPVWKRRCWGSAENGIWWMEIYLMQLLTFVKPSFLIFVSKCVHVVERTTWKQHWCDNLIETPHAKITNFPLRPRAPITDVRPKEIQTNLYFNKTLLEGDRCKNIDDLLKCEALYKPF